ncbi:hypothetical protein Cni_G14951 [Canna indica]|uniref:Uncharacterized protein n=1 Tax=Canna indica TaxID=4628 RepID=A0AAQ3KCK2_9LILI|nr:hypothetical protein Cni_G14951 [Canna indica]
MPLHYSRYTRAIRVDAEVEATASSASTVSRWPAMWTTRGSAPWASSSGPITDAHIHLCQ